MNRKKARWKRMVIVGLLTAAVLLYSFNAVLAAPPHPPPYVVHPPGPPHVYGPPAPWRAAPPPGRIWFHFQGAWVAVPPPPGAGPYIWNGSVWMVDPAPAPVGARWVAGVWTSRGWIGGHWTRYPAPRPNAHWVPGYWGPRGHWVPGRWR